LPFDGGAYQPEILLAPPVDLVCALGGRKIHPIKSDCVAIDVAAPLKLTIAIVSTA
jgi:hypothetical protein